MPSPARACSNKQSLTLIRNIAVAAAVMGAVLSAPLTSAATKYIATPLGSDNYDGYGINASGQIIGTARTSTSPVSVFHAFLYDGNTGTDLGVLGGVSSYGFAINSSGQATGGARIGPPIDYFHAVIYANGKIMDLGTLAGGV